MGNGRNAPATINVFPGKPPYVESMWNRDRRLHPKLRSRFHDSARFVRSHRGVVDAAVMGRASDLRGEDVIAFVETDGRIDDLDEFAASQLARYKRPIDIHVVDALPRNALGKVLKHELSP